MDHLSQSLSGLVSDTDKVIVYVGRELDWIEGPPSVCPGVGTSSAATKLLGMITEADVTAALISKERRSGSMTGQWLMQNPRRGSLNDSIDD